jgi:hypothetical protein
MEHLNYCRQMTKQFLVDISQPGANKAMLAHAIDLAAASTKFILPDGGRLVDDPLLKGIDESQPLRLPYPFIALEYSRSEYHGGRKVWHALYLHSDADRDALLQRAGVEKLPHRSDECSPCVNANRGDLRRLSGRQMGKLAALEAEVGQPMFRAAKHAGAQGIEQVIHWAKYSPGQYKPGMDDLFTAGCGSPFGCGL